MSSVPIRLVHGNFPELKHTYVITRNQALELVLPRMGFWKYGHWTMGNSYYTTTPYETLYETLLNLIIVDVIKSDYRLWILVQIAIISHNPQAPHICTPWLGVSVEPQKKADNPEDVASATAVLHRSSIRPSDTVAA